uniref:Uncharacterized protein n=1 Tax=Calcidiscus leptoporus TaxID=127549 RepID=A0A7S0ISP8_9EUKA|mmetsp:Transcript_20344/g.46984  ORF Transcript_20344/g.46984 Transcript_20344/m.46984 type:complete len:151 (+) Transcript_20344:26-478(+)
MRRNAARCSEDDEPRWLKDADSTLSDLMARGNRSVVTGSASSGMVDLVSEGLQLQQQAHRLAAEAAKSVRGRRKRRLRYASHRIDLATRWLVEAVGAERVDAPQKGGCAVTRSTLSEIKRPRERGFSPAPPRKRRIGGAIAHGARLVEVL